MRSRLIITSNGRVVSGVRTSRFAASAVIAVVAAGLGQSAVGWADPLPGEVLKFYQAPLNNVGPIYPPQAAPTPLDIPASPQFPGHDELSTAVFSSASNGYTGTMMADDFGDTFTTPIVHVMFWGSYMNGTEPSPTAGAGVKRFQITFYTDKPGVTGTPSSPLTPYSSQTVTLTTSPLLAASGNFTESKISGSTGGLAGESGLYQYNAELAVPVPEPVGGQFSSPVDWISIVALTGGPQDGNPNIVWGWHDRDYGIFDPLAIGANAFGPGENNLNPGLVNPAGQPVWHFQDDAVSNPTFALNGTAFPTANPSGYAPQSYIPGVDIASSQQYSKDLAFALYTVPEPASLGLLAMAGLAMFRRRSRG